MRTFQVRVEPEWSVTTPKIVKILRATAEAALMGVNSEHSSRP